MSGGGTRTLTPPTATKGFFLAADLLTATRPDKASADRLGSAG